MILSFSTLLTLKTLFICLYTFTFFRIYLAFDPRFWRYWRQNTIYMFIYMLRFLSKNQLEVQFIRYWHDFWVHCLYTFCCFSFYFRFYTILTFISYIGWSIASSCFVKTSNFIEYINTSASFVGSLWGQCIVLNVNDVKNYILIQSKQLSLWGGFGPAPVSHKRNTIYIYTFTQAQHYIYIHSHKPNTIYIYTYPGYNIRTEILDFDNPSKLFNSST